MMPPLRSLAEGVPHGYCHGSVANYRKQESLVSQAIDFSTYDLHVWPQKRKFATEPLLLHIEQGKHRKARVWRGSSVGFTLEGSDGVELCSLCWKHDGYRYKAE